MIIQPLLINKDFSKLDVFHDTFNVLFDSDQAEFKSLLPDEYLKFLEKYGEGIIGNFICFLIPMRSYKGTQIFRNNFDPIISTYFKNEIENFTNKVVLIGNTTEDDQIFYYLHNYYVFQLYGEDQLHHVGQTLESVLEFYQSGITWEEIDCTIFTPFDSSMSKNFFNI